MKKTNYHTHTYRCGHANGNEEEMVKAAIKNNIEILGFSCHVPLPHYRRHLLKGIRHVWKDKRTFLSFSRAFITGGPGMRMPYYMLEDHLKQVSMMKEKYQNDIKIYQGFEAEYFKEYLPYYKKLLTTGKIDYLILGHHFNKYSIHNHYYGKADITNEEIIQYKEDVIQALETNLFSYLAHPDLFMIGKIHWDDFVEGIAREICLKAKELDIPLEINAGGIRRGLQKVDDELVYPYTNYHFFKVASEVGNKVVLGMDAHGPDEFDDGTYQTMIEFANKLNLEIVNTFEFRKPN